MLGSFRSPLSVKELVRRTAADTLEDGCPGLAAQLAFYFFLALFPTLLFLVALLAYLPVEPALANVMNRLDSLLPPAALTIVRGELDRLLDGGHGGLMTFAVAGAIWSSSTAMTAIIATLNRAFDVEEFRPWWRARLTAIALTIALAVFVIAAFALVIGGIELAEWVAAWLGLGGAFARIWRAVQWPLAFMLVVVAVDLVYHFAPNVKTRWSWLTPGSLLATLLWLAASIVFRIYVQNFSNYTVVYGAIGSVIVLLLWFYVSGFALLVGAELNAELHKALVGGRGSGRPGDSGARVRRRA
jgi:membrane protein